MIEPGPSETRELKALMFDLTAVMKKHGQIEPQKSLVPLFSVISAQFQTLLKSKDYARRVKILGLMDRLMDATKESIENGYPLFQEQIEP